MWLQDNSWEDNRRLRVYHSGKSRFDHESSGRQAESERFSAGNTVMTVTSLQQLYKADLGHLVHLQHQRLYEMFLGPIYFRNQIPYPLYAILHRDSFLHLSVPNELHLFRHT